MFTVMEPSKVWAICFGVAVFFLYWLQTFTRTRIPKGYKLPPGPQKRFLVGNLFDAPSENQKQICRKWPEQYGDLTYLNVLGTSILFVNSYQLAVQLFERRGGTYTNRFQSTILMKLAGFTWHTAMRPADEIWKHHRTLFNKFFGKSSMEEYQELFERNSRDLLCRLYQTPDKFLSHARHIVDSMIIEITFGLKTLPENDPYIEVTRSTLELLDEVASPGEFLVDFLPIMQYIPSWAPGASFKRKSEELKAGFHAMSNVPFSAARDRVKLGTAPPSIVRTLLEELYSKEPYMTAEKERDIQNLCMTIYTTSIDPIDAELQMFFFTMMLFPEAQKKAQEELDKVLGGSALPSMKDRKNLPYTDALCNEVRRWHPVAAFGFPYVLKENDVIGDYFIPKGTLVIRNLWSLLESTSIYGDDVENFKPERFLNSDVSFPEMEFGIGRRICPGRHFADDAQFSIMANILYVYDIRAYDTPTRLGLSVRPEDFSYGLVSRPKPFKCKLTPRSEQKKALLEYLINAT